jgi:hypothetical protein
MRIARQLSIGLALFVGLALLPTSAKASIQIYDPSNNPVPGTTITLAQLLGGYKIDINNGFDTKEFTGVAGSFSSTNLTAGAINVTAHDDGGLNPGPGLVFTGNFNAAAGTTQDTDFTYHVAVLTPGFLIHDISLTAVGVVPAGGRITVTETASANGNAAGIMTLQLPSGQTSKTTDMTFIPGVTAVTIHKDINLMGGTSAQTTLTDIEQRFSQSAVPEPSTMALAGLGALGFIGYGLRRRKASGA